MAEPSILGALRDPQFRADTLRNLVDALNGAKRSLTVGSLGAVGDMGSTLANLVRAGAGTAYHEATGRPIPQALEYRDPARDFGTSASLGNFAERQGWLPPQTFSMPEQAGALLGPIAAMKAPDLAQSTLRGLVNALKSEPSRRMVEGYMGGMGMKPQAIVWHGSPHTFDAFDSSKIGTGEGAQAYGHGLYLAETPAVADGYRRDLSDLISVDGKTIQQSNRQVGSTGSPSIDDYLMASRGDLNAAIADAKREMERARVGYPHALPEIAQELASLEALRGRVKVEQGGFLYKVDLPDPLIARMLDWDKPLSQQAPEVQRAVNDYTAVNGIRVDRNTSGKQLYDLFGKHATAGNSYSPSEYSKVAKKAAEELRWSGIPGIRYLDGGSRADGAGTSNFVVFPGEESALTILERNGQPVRR